MNSPGCRRRRAGLGLPPPASLLAESAAGELAPSLPPPSVDPRRSPPTTANPLRPVHLPLHSTPCAKLPPLRRALACRQPWPRLAMLLLPRAWGTPFLQAGSAASRRLRPGGDPLPAPTPPRRPSPPSRPQVPAPLPSVLSPTCAHKMIVLACCAERRKDEVGEVLSAPRQFYTRSCC